MSTPKRTVSEDGDVGKLLGAAKLIGKIQRGSELKIDPLPWQEWDFRRCPVWEKGRCWEYELQRESKRVRAGIGKWREEFPKWVDWRLKKAEEDWDWESVQDPKTGEWNNITPCPIDQKEKQQRRARFESFYLAFVAPVTGWLLQDFPEFPEKPYLAIEPPLRKGRLGRLGCTPREPRPIVPLDMTPVMGLLAELAKREAGVNFDSLPSELASPKAHLAAWRAKIGEAIKNDDLPFMRCYVTRRLRVADVETDFETDVVLTIPWYESKKRLVKRFGALLDDLEETLTERAQVIGGSGSTTPGDLLKKLGAFRLLRRCRGNWEEAAKMAAEVLPKDRELYDNQAAWSKAGNDIDGLLRKCFTSNGFDPIR
jgi:hypothetical protein